MSSYIDHITEFLFDEHRRLSSKAAVVVFAFLTILLIDNVLGFSYYFSIDKKVEQIQKLNSIIKDSTTDNTTKTFAINLRSEILKRENIINQSFSFFRNIKLPSSKKDQINPTNDPAKTIDVSIRNNFWFHITAGGIYYLIAILALPIMIFRDKKTSLPQRIATGILAAALFFGFGWLFYWLFNFIPQVSTTTWIWNYIINLVLQFSLIGLLVMTNQKKK